MKGIQKLFVLFCIFSINLIPKFSLFFKKNLKLDTQEVKELKFT